MQEGILPKSGNILIRYEAPIELRRALLLLLQRLRVRCRNAREVICSVLVIRPDANNWAENDVWNEVDELLEEAPWNKIYDLILQFDEFVLSQCSGKRIGPAAKFQKEMNRICAENGIGWELRDGHLVRRVAEAYSRVRGKAPTHLDKAGLANAREELRQAFRAMDQRQNPKVTGAIKS